MVSGSNHQFSLLRIFFADYGINLNLGRYKKDAFKSFFRRRNLRDIIKRRKNSSKEYIYIYIYTSVFKKVFIQRQIYTFVFLHVSCVHFPLVIVQHVKNLGSRINLLFVRFFVPI